jgi:CBS domain-containing protein
MRRYHIGVVVVVDVIDGAQIPVGILTDRDIVVELVAMDLDPADYTVGDIMSRDPVTVPEDYDVFETIRKMRTEGVRRMPVVNARGALTGIVSIDDLLPMVAGEISELAKLPLVGRRQECELRH